MHKFGVEEWLASAVMSMSTGAKTVVRTVYGNSKCFVALHDVIIHTGIINYHYYSQVQHHAKLHRYLLMPDTENKT